MNTIIAFIQNIPLDLLLIQTVNGIVTGMILALVASGLTLIFGIMDVVNFAHGELFMLGAYVMYSSPRCSVCRSLQASPPPASRCSWSGW